ncbi:hypothetical protein ACFFRR_005953 [Megaselia abdita]
MVGDYSKALLAVVLLSNAIALQAATNHYQPPSSIGRLEQFFEGSGAGIIEDFEVNKELSEIEAFEDHASNEIDVKNNEYISRDSRKLDIFNTTDVPKLKFLIPTESPKILQRLKNPRQGRTINDARAQLFDDLEVVEDDDSENKQVDEMFAIEPSSSDESSNSQSNSSDDSNSSSDSDGSSSEEHASSSSRPLGDEHIEIDEGSGSEALVELSTETSRSSSEPVEVLPTEAPKISTSESLIITSTQIVEDIIISSTEATRFNILTEDILNRIEEASTGEPASSTTTPNFVDPNLESISTSSIMDNTAESLVASSENKPLPTLNIENIYQSNITKSAVIVVAICVSSVVLLAIIGLVYMVNHQRQTGTLDIEMQEQRCGKDSYADDELEDETHERLLGTQDANTVTTVDDIL